MELDEEEADPILDAFFKVEIEPPKEETEVVAEEKGVEESKEEESAA